MSYTIQQLKEIAKTNPQELVKIISNSYGTDIKTIALAIDILSEEITDEQIIVPLTKRLLKHVHVLIRESAIMCTASYYTDKQVPQDIVDRLNIISKNDPSINLRELAADTLKDFKR